MSIASVSLLVMREAGEPHALHTVLAFDFGLKRIGLASGDTLTGKASPRPAVAVSQKGPDWFSIEREVRSLRPRVLVVGAPYNADGTPGALAKAARRFASELEERFGLPISRVDERWSSLEANEAIDSAAAAVILERWFAGEGGNACANGDPDE
jgi:putative holliday junction resolvase